MRDEDVGYERRVRGEGPRKTRVHARRRPKRGAGETESKDYFGIGGDKPGQPSCAYAKERKRERKREERLREREKKREKKRERKRETGHKRSEPRLALPRRKHERSLEA